MAKPSASFLLIISFLQINIIIVTNGLTLPLQAITTKCESFTKKPLNQETNVGTEEQDLDNVIPSADFSYSPFLPPDPSTLSVVSPVTSTLVINCPLNNVLDISESHLPNLPKDNPLTISDNIDYEINMLPSHSDPYTIKSVSIPESDLILQSLDSNQDLKLPIIVSSSVTSLPLSNSFSPTMCIDGSTIDVDKQCNIYSTDNIETLRTELPTNPLLTTPLYNNIVNSNLNPLSSDITPDILISANPMFTADLITQSFADFDATSFELPQIHKYVPTFDPSNNNNVQSGLTSSPSVTISSLNTLDLLLNSLLFTDSVAHVPCQTNDKFVLPMDSYIETLPTQVNYYNDILEIPNTKRETLNGVSTPVCSNLKKLESQPNESRFVSSSNDYTNPICSLREFLNKIMPQTASINNILPNYLAGRLPDNNNGNVMQSIFTDNAYNSPTMLPVMNQDVSHIMPGCVDSYNLPILSSVTLCNEPILNQHLPSPGLTLPVSSSCLVSSFNNGENINLNSPYSLTNNVQTSEIVYPFIGSNVEGLAGSDPNSCIGLFSHDYISSLNSQLPYASDLTYPTSQLPFPASTSQNIANSILTTYNPYILNLPDSKSLMSTENSVASLDSNILPINRDSPIIKYFEEVRSVTEKLNEFIDSFTSRTSCTNSLPLLSATNTILSPRQLLEPNILPKQTFSLSSSYPHILCTNTYEKENTFILPLAETCAVTAPKVPPAMMNSNVFPFSSNPEYYKSFQNAISSLSYSNFLPYPYYSFSTANPTQNLPFRSSRSTCWFPENPFTRSKSAISKNCFTSINTNDEGITSIVMPDILSTVSAKLGKNLNGCIPKKPLPYLQSVSVNSAPLTTCTCTNQPSLSSVDGNLMMSCCDNVEKMISLLELSTVLNNQPNCDLNTLNGILSIL